MNRAAISNHKMENVEFRTSVREHRQDEPGPGFDEISPSQAILTSMRYINKSRFTALFIRHSGIAASADRLKRPSKGEVHQ